MTRRQRDLLQFISDYMEREGVPPSYIEMVAGLKVSSKSQIHAALTSLKKRGYVLWMKGYPRSVQVLHPADAPPGSPPFCPKCGRDLVVAA